MESFVVTVKEKSKQRFIWNLLKEFDYVSLKKQKDGGTAKKHSAKKQQVLDNLSKAVEEIKLYKEGKIELQDAFEMIAEVEKELSKEDCYAN